MLSLAPLPTWRNLARAIFHRPPIDSILAAPWCRPADVAGWMSRSAWSLALIALWRQRRAPESPVVVWLPDFFCNMSLAPLRSTGAKLVFYSLTDALAPDVAACRARIDVEPPDLFLLVHYFGQSIPAASTRQFCMRKGAWLIEDAAHVLRPTGGIGTCGDFVLYSAHKLLPVPIGAVLVVCAKGPARFAADEIAAFGAPITWPDQLHDLGQRMGCSTFRDRRREVVWLAKRILQKLGVGAAYRSGPPFQESPRLGSADSFDFEAPQLGGFARRLLGVLHTELETFARYRQRHQLLWDALLLGEERRDLIQIAAAARPACREWTPYLANYQAQSEVSEATYTLWRQKGVPVMTWPDLPPEVKADRASRSYVWKLRHSHLYLPVHQSLNARGILKQWRSPKATTGIEPDVKMIWNTATRLQWQSWEARAERSNLMQNWAYGEAKSVCSGWNVRRGVFHRGSEPIALVQILEKRITGILNLARINRGPLYLRTLRPGEHQALWRELSRFGGFWRANVLTVAPELTLSGSSLALLADLGFRQSSTRAWESAWVDLGLDLGELRARQDGKWRNALVFAEKSGLELEIASDDSTFQWMLARYRELMLKNTFAGPPIKLLLALRDNLDDKSQLLILRAMSEGQPVSGICLVCHGTTATYLLGWNGEKGRFLKANQFLLWSAVVRLKQSGLRWFDLGGINEERTPGISAFKLGLNGERYELVGEYWKW